MSGCCSSTWCVMTDIAPEEVIRAPPGRHAARVFVGHPHRGAAGSEIFESAAELTALLEDLNAMKDPPSWCW